MRIGVLGGTFDPPHYAHLMLAEQARDQLSLDRLLWVPAADPPHKRNEVGTDIEHRLAMVRLAIEDNPSFSLSLVDVERPGPHYTVDMLSILHNQYPGGTFYFLVGSDSLRDLPTWHRPDELVTLTHFAVLKRSGVEVDLDQVISSLPGLAGRITLIDAPCVEIAASDIRSRVWEKRSIRYFVPPAVVRYIEERGLYRD